MKKIIWAMPVLLTVILVACTGTPGKKGSPFGSRPASEVTAQDVVKYINAGWNLGNTLDTHNLHWMDADSPVSDFETGWNNKTLTSQETIDLVRTAGFNTIRLPVSWAKCADEEYNIRQDWMERVSEVVGYAVNNNMLIIINTHHDEKIFKFMNDEMEESTKAFSRIWEQIAENFKDHGPYLIFEGLNEPRTIGSPREWQGGTLEEHKNLIAMNQLFVDTVRATGGNNAHRVLMVPTYAASSQRVPITNLLLPKDTVENRIIVSIHAYEPYNFALNEDKKFDTWSKDDDNDTGPMRGAVDRVYNQFVAKGIPVILGEIGAVGKGNDDARAEWAAYYFGYAKSKGIPCIWWDNGGNFRILDRNINTIEQPKIVNAIMKAVK